MNRIKPSNLAAQSPSGPPDVRGVAREVDKAIKKHGAKYKPIAWKNHGFLFGRKSK
jgi:hypothetical protein